MAAVTSLGVHTPAALPHLIAEGILPPDPKDHQYRWQTHVAHDGDDQIEEELLITKNVVVWSQGSFIRNVYRFDLEGEHVTQALFTRFPSSSRPVPRDAPTISGTTRTPRKRIRLSTSLDDFRREEAQPRPEETLARALVVLLKTKAHIYFLHGASHIVHLPFEVERAYPAPRGLVLQRKRTANASLPPTPMMPNAPPNSFWSSQGQPSQSHLQSPTLMKSLPNTRPALPSRLGGDNRLEALFQTTIVAPSREGDEDVTNLYSLTSPLSDLGVITYALHQHKPRLYSKPQQGLSVEFEGLDPAEEVIYVSPEDELLHRLSNKSSQLHLMVTVNCDINTVTVWHMWYKDEKSLRVLLKQRAEHKAAKARRRSSFVSAKIGTGSTTPAVRPREKHRESFAATGLTNSQGDQTSSQGAVLSRKQTRQDEEEVMASQMDPDYQPGTTQQPARENRRVSSMNADVRASQSTVTASFAGTGGRRVTSFGGEHSRRSLNHRKSRGSTPGSIYGQSLGGDEDSMDLDTTIEFDPDESIDGILRHIRATYDATGIDDVFGSTEEGFKRELIVRKVHSCAVGFRASAHGTPGISSDRYRVATLAESSSVNGKDDSRLRLYLHDRQTKELQYVALKIKHKQIWPELSQSPMIAIPLLTGENKAERCEDLARIQDGDVQALLLGSNGLQFSLDEQPLCPLPQPAPYRVYNALELKLHSEDADDIGKNRTMLAPSSTLSFEHIGSQGRYDEFGGDGFRHRRRLQLAPRNPQIQSLLTLCELILPKKQARTVRKIWCIAHAQIDRQPELLAGTSSCQEYVALVATVFTFVFAILDPKARAAVRLLDMANGKAQTSTSISRNLQNSGHEVSSLSSAVWSWGSLNSSPSSQMSPRSREKKKDQLIVVASGLAENLHKLSSQDDQAGEFDPALTAVRFMLALHIFKEEKKLCVLRSEGMALAPMIAQLGSWLGLREWSYEAGQVYELEGSGESHWAYVHSTPKISPQLTTLEKPVTVFQWFEHALQHASSERYPSLHTIAQLGADSAVPKVSEAIANKLTPRIIILSDILAGSGGLITTSSRTVELLTQKHMVLDMLETLPEAIAAPFREAISCCEKEPPTTWRDDLLQIVGRTDLIMKSTDGACSTTRPPTTPPTDTRDILSVTHSVGHSSTQHKTREAGRHAISQLIFSDDRRLVEATSLMHFNSVQVGHCAKQPDWDETYHFEQQRKVMHFVTIRMIALPAGDGMLHFDSQTPLLTEKFPLPGFNSSCIMQPMGHTLTADRTGLTEEKVNWAYFHAGASAGLRISRDVKGIDTSWIAFNKPVELTNRHAGFLLALGVGGHLKHMAKWLSFKYLTPKHTMTSVGLLLGLSASHIGTMDGLITRMLSVHITKMLPPGAAELNVSPATQTAGLMGIGLLYYNTQHRRMSEVMLSEIEYLEVEDPDSGPDQLRDECYRLAAGFALGFINLAKGSDLRGLHGMQLPERLLAMAIGPRPVNAVHVFDRATAGAVVALALVYMKSGDKTIARKIDIPDSEAQFDQVRPDILMLRSMAKHIILWDSIEARGPTYDQGWIQDNLPACYKNRSKSAFDHMMVNRTIDSKYVPLFNVFTGLAWALSLKYAGSGNTIARDEILTLLGFFQRLSEGADAFYFDGKLARSALRRCMDALALAAATVMAGTGDLDTFRYLRRMHGRTDADTPYGSHFASHLAIGVLFLGGGTFTLATSDLALAAMMVSFYPIFPIDVHDNRVHLQAFRHLWVLAAKARCVVVEDIDTQRPIHMPMLITLRNGQQKQLRAPCLLPELDSIATVQTNDPDYWRVTLDFEANPAHLEAFRKDQHISVRRCPATEAHDSVFTAALAALSDMSLNAQPHLKNGTGSGLWQTLLALPAFEGLDKPDVEMLLPPEMNSIVYSDDRTTVVDDRLVLSKAVRSDRGEDLWNLRVLFAWLERCREAKEHRIGNDRHMREDEDEDEEGEIEGMRWLGEEVVQELKAAIEERARGAGA